MELIRSNISEYFNTINQMREETIFKREYEVQRYFEGLQSQLSFIRRYLDMFNQRIAFNFNVFDYIQPNENRVSDIIADLLSNTGKHGQGDAFLLAFLKTIGLSISFSNYTVLRESYTVLIDRSMRRMDILIDFYDKGIMIENKLDAKDLENQISDYKRHLENRYGNNYYIVYLSKFNECPSEISISSYDLQDLIAAKRFIRFNYSKHFLDWINNCISCCESEKIRLFCEDFKSYINKTL